LRSSSQRRETHSWKSNARGDDDQEYEDLEGHARSLADGEVGRSGILEHDTLQDVCDVFSAVGDRLEHFVYGPHFMTCFTSGSSRNSFAMAERIT
jgi:hypothetical protein